MGAASSRQKSRRSSGRKHSASKEGGQYGMDSRQATRKDSNCSELTSMAINRSGSITRKVTLTSQERSANLMRELQESNVMMSPIEVVDTALREILAGRMSPCADVLEDIIHLLNADNLHCPLALQSFSGPPWESDDGSDEGDGKTVPKTLNNGVVDWEMKKFLLSTSSITADIGIRPSVARGKPADENRERGGRASLDVGQVFELDHIVGAKEQSKAKGGKYNIDQIRVLMITGGSWDFDMVQLAALTGGRPVSVMGFFFFQRFELVEECSLRQVELLAYLRHVDTTMPSNPYHNNVHLADVANNLVYLMEASGVSEVLSPLEKFVAIFAALIHDYLHVGFNNEFLKNISHPLALRYNDRGILENYHVAEAWQLLQRPEFNFLADMRPDELARVRALVIDMVLATDMRRHFELVDTFNVRAKNIGSALAYEAAQREVALPGHAEGDRVSKLLDGTGGSNHGRVRVSTSSRRRMSGNSLGLKENDKLLLLQLMIKVADLGHIMKRLDLHLHWTQRVVDEFYRQGDAERSKGMPITTFMDRQHPNVPKAQVGTHGGWMLTK
eukprot:jgi/Mesvir1/6838/Mv09017-RA.1